MTPPGWQHDPRQHLSRCPIIGVHFFPPLDQDEVLSIANSVCRYTQGKTKPKHIWLDLIRSEDGPKDPAVRHILKDLVSFMNGNDTTCYPTHETLSRTTGIHQKTIGKHLRSASNDGWIDVIGHKGEGQQWRNNIYSLSLPPKVATKHSQLLARFWTSALKVGTIHAKGGSNTFPYTSSNTNHMREMKLQRMKERGKDC